MKTYGRQILLLASLLLALALAWLWVGLDGSLRGVRWQPPAAHKPDFSSLVPALPIPPAATLDQFVATLDRPLFSPNRRPPPPAPEKDTQTAQPDPLANIRLHGVISSPSGGSVIATFDGKAQRVRINESIGSWRLAQLQGRDVTLERAGETRVLQLSHARAPTEPAQAALADLAADGAAETAAQGAPSAKQKQDEFVRGRKARINAGRVKAGLPPLP